MDDISDALWDEENQRKHLMREALEALRSVLPGEPQIQDWISESIDRAERLQDAAPMPGMQAPAEPDWSTELVRRDITILECGQKLTQAAAIIRRLSWRLCCLDPESDAPDNAMLWLKKNGLTGSVLRDGRPDLAKGE